MVFYVERSRAQSPTSGALFRGSHQVLALLVVAAVPACSRAQPAFEDTEGRTYSAKCGEHGCTIEREGDAALGPNESRVFQSPGRVVGVCRGPEGGAVIPPASCRPLVCKGDSGCPPAHGLKHGTCVNGLCTEPANALQVADAVMLCLAGTGWGQGTPAQVERFALALNCGSPCKIPTPCRQP